MIEDLYKIHDELPEAAEDFVISLKENLDPFEPLRDQLIGLPESVDKQEKWLYRLHKKHVDLEDLEDWDDED